MRRRFGIGTTLGLGICALLMASGAAGQDWDSGDDRYGTRDVRDDRRSYDTEVSPRERYGDRDGWGARLGLGFVADPTIFLLDLTVPYSLGSGTSLGPRVQLGLAEDDIYLAPTLDFEYSHDLSESVSGSIGLLRPLVHAGLGFGWLHEDDRRGKDDDVEFLVDIGAGVEYPLTERFALASVIDFNIFPVELLDQNLVFTWQVVQLRLKF